MHIILDDYYTRSKERSFQKDLSQTNDVWNANHFNAVNVVGPMMELFREFHNLTKSLSLEDFMTWYFDTTHPQKTMTESEFKNLVKRFAGNANITFTEAKVQSIHRLFYETIKGGSKEKRLTNWINPRLTNGFKIEEAPSENDAKYAVDLLVYDENGIALEALQVKPVSYFFGKNAMLKEQQELNKEKNDNYDLPVSYVYYASLGAKDCFQISSEYIRNNIE